MIFVFGWLEGSRRCGGEVAGVLGEMQQVRKRLWKKRIEQPHSKARMEVWKERKKSRDTSAGREVCEEFASLVRLHFHSPTEPLPEGKRSDVTISHSMRELFQVIFKFFFKWIKPGLKKSLSGARVVEVSRL